MTPLEEIRARIAPDIERLNAIIAGTLTSGSAMTNGIVTNYLRLKGKQIRPVLVLLSAEFFGGVTDATLQAGAAIEMLHNASLIHDDVIDRSKERRGVATINSIWDNHVAVLTGDFFISGALTCAVRTGDMRVLNVLSRMGAELSLGEIDQIDSALRHNIDEDFYMSVIERKTASLFTSCVEVGGITAKAPTDALRDLKRFATLLGICFQIKDDTFDYFHDPAVGKPTGNDLREGKITLPLIYALNNADSPEREAMKQLVQKDILTDDEINTLVEFAKSNGGIEYAVSVMRHLQKEAEALLEPFLPHPTIDDFKAIFNFIIDRDK